MIISTHAPLAGRDARRIGSALGATEFQPTRPLRGATAARHAESFIVVKFQPTRPLRGATCRRGRWRRWRCNFNPRAPCGARQRPPSTPTTCRHFNPRAPCGARPFWRLAAHRRSAYFNPRAPCGARRQRRSRGSKARGISTHAPLAGRDSKSVQITMHIFAITDKFQMLLHRMPPVRAFCSFLMQENHADFGCEPPK